METANTNLTRIGSVSALDWIVFHRIHLTFCSVCALWCSARVLHVQYRLSTWIMVCLSVTVVYQLNRISDFNEDRQNAPREYEFNKRHLTEITLISLGSFFILIALFISQTIVLIYALPLLGLGLLYNFKILDPMPRLKSIPIVKNIASAFGWAFAVVIFPCLVDNISISTPAIVLFVYLFLGVFSSEVLWDLRDIVGDKVNGIRTIPILFGRESTRRLLLFINWLALSLIIICASLGQVPLLWLLFIVNNVASIFWTSFAKKMQVDRRLSHQILGIQILVLIIMGFLF
jgi:4-hydroxybenzoate polyprenyltransferase